MNTDLKKAIITFMFDNVNEFQLVNATTKEFRQYIYTPDGNYCIGGELYCVPEGDWDLNGLNWTIIERP